MSLSVCPPLEELEAASVVSMHAAPQPGPQEWDCGCVTAVHVTDADVLRGGRPFEMRLVHRCGKRACVVRWEVPPRIGAEYRSVVSKSGRRWRVWRHHDWQRASTLVPLGGGWGAGGGVKAIRIEWDRLNNLRLWERLNG